MNSVIFSPGNPSNCKMPSELSSPAKLLPLSLDATIPENGKINNLSSTHHTAVI